MPLYNVTKLNYNFSYRFRTSIPVNDFRAVQNRHASVNYVGIDKEDYSPYSMVLQFTFHLHIPKTIKGN